MLLKGSIVFCYDNSGCNSFKIVQLYSTLTNRGGESFRGVLHVFNPNKNKLQRKKHYVVACIGVIQYTQRKSSDLIQFPDNAILMLSDNKKKLLGTRIYGTLQREALRIKKLEEALVQKIVLLSRFVI